MRTAISPRLAISNREMGILFDLEQRLTRHDRLLIAGDKANDLAARVSVDFDERLHHFNQSHDVADRDDVAVGFVSRLVRSRLAIKDSRQGSENLFGHGNLSG